MPFNCISIEQHEIIQRSYNTKIHSFDSLLFRAFDEKMKLSSFFERKLAKFKSPLNIL